MRGTRLFQRLNTRQLPALSKFSSRSFSISAFQFRPHHNRNSTSPFAMTDLAVEITAPNGKKYTQPTGLFINNEFVKGNGGTIVSIDPACVIDSPLAYDVALLTFIPAPKQRLRQSTLPVLTTSIAQCVPLALP
jgi:hypothetical protein